MSRIPKTKLKRFESETLRQNIPPNSPINNIAAYAKKIVLVEKDVSID